MSYVELHSHSAFSFLDGASSPEELVAAAIGQGYGALALTDHDSVAGSMEFAMAAAEQGLRAIHGAEVSVAVPTDRGGRATGGGPAGRPGATRSSGDAPSVRHLTLLVRDHTGWRNLCRLLTLAHAHTRDGPGRTARPPSVTLDQVEEHAAGLVCLSGCATRGIHDEPGMRWLLRAFGRDAFRVELQRPYAHDDRARNRRLAALADRLGVPTVATGNVHAHTPIRALLQDTLVAIRHGMTLDGSEPLRRPNHSHVLTHPAAMAARFADHPEAVAETERLAETLTFDLRKGLGYHYPGSDDPAAGRRLAEACRGMLEERYPPGHRFRHDAIARLEEELRTIDGLDLSGFFVLHRDILELAREVAVEVRGPDTVRALLPPGRGRGSSVSSIVCYLTGLSHIDPIEHELGLGRFLHDDLEALPDIDLDFPRDIREVLIPRIHERYGSDHSALVAAFPTYRPRGIVRELGQALGLPAAEIERVARGADGWGGTGSVARDIASALGPQRLQGGRWAWLARLAEEAYRLPRHLSQHSGGMIVSTRPLIDCCPVVPAAMEGRQIVQWDKDSCADAGFLKIDLLGLGMLSAVERCVELIARRRGTRVDLSRIPLDDTPTFDCICAADTTGVFQIESRAQMGSLRRTQPRTLQDLTVQVAIVRPGPIVGGAVNPYIERCQRLRIDPHFRIPYEHPSLEEPLRMTLGTIIFQDQVIEVAKAFAGFSPGQAEGLRRAMSRKRSDEAIEAHHRAFVAGAIATHGVDEGLAERVFAMVRGFSGFGFPKAHGAAFGLLAYQSTWLRVHYGPEFLCALLDAQPMGFYPPDSLIHEAQRRGITVLGPDVTRSQVLCTVTDEGAVRLGLGYVAGVAREEVAALVDEREAHGPFRSLGDLAGRVGAGRASLGRLAWSGACDGLAGGGVHARRTALWRLGVATPGRRLGKRHETSIGTQLALDLGGSAVPALPQLGDWDAMLADYASTGVSIARHPLGLLRPSLTARGAVSSADLPGIRHGTRVTVGGFVVARQRPGTAKGVVFLLLEDESGTLNVIVPPKVYDRDRTAVRTEPLIVASGRLERHADGGGAVNLIADRVLLLETPDQLPATVTDLRQRAEAANPPADAGQAGQADDFRAVAPPAMSFAQGRRR